MHLLKLCLVEMPNHISSCYLKNAFENSEIYDSHNMSDCDVNDNIFLS